METLASPFRFVMSVRLALEQGTSLRVALKEFTQRERSDFAEQLSLWFLRGGVVSDLPRYPQLQKNAFRSTVVRTLSAGLSGKPVLEQMRTLEKELHRASLGELEEDLRVLPTKLMLPLLFFHFPAFLLLVIGPLLRQLGNALGGVP